MADFKDMEREAAAQRQKLAGSIDALGAAMNPDNVKQHASALVETYGGDLGRQAWGAARQNPAAFALVGAGLSLLFTGTGSRAETRPAPLTAVPPNEALAGFDDRIAEADSAMKKEMSGMLNEPAPRAAWLRAKLNDGLDALPASARARVLDARKVALVAQEKVELQTQRTAKASKTFLHEQPLAVGAIALGIGALIGALLPSTRREDDLLGEHRDNVMSVARSTLSQELDKVHTATRSAIKGGSSN